MKNKYSKPDTFPELLSESIIPETIKDTFKKIPRKVLVLEDDLALQTTLTRIIHTISPEIEISWMTTADEASKEIIRVSQNAKDYLNKYDLILADIGTPGKKTGLHFWTICQKKCPDTPFMFISGMPVDAFLRSVGTNTICPPYLPKPFSVGECRQLIEGLLRYERHNLA